MQETLQQRAHLRAVFLTPSETSPGSNMSRPMSVSKASPEAPFPAAQLASSAASARLGHTRIGTDLESMQPLWASSQAVPGFSC